MTLSRSPCPAVLLALVLLGVCTTKPKTDTAQQPPPAPVVSDPSPPPPPNSVEVPADIKNMPTFLLMAVGGLADEGEKEGIEIQENVRLFQTDAAAPEIVSFYAKEMKDRGWTTDHQVARSSKVGLTMQEYRRAAASEALYLIISEPEDGETSAAGKDKRHVALLPAKVKKRSKP
jgi:hypothetical protein